MLSIVLYPGDPEIEKMLITVLRKLGPLAMLTSKYATTVQNDHCYNFLTQLHSYFECYIEDKWVNPGLGLM